MSNRNFALPHTELAGPIVIIPSPNTNTNNPQGNTTQTTKGLPAWAWVLIIIGILLIVTLIIVLIWYLVKKGKQSPAVESAHQEAKAKDKDNSPVTAPSIKI